MKYSTHSNGLTLEPESIEDVVQIENITRKSRGEPMIPSDVSDWIVDYFQYIEENGFGSGYSLGELIEDGTIATLVTELTGGVSLDECSVAQFIPDAFGDGFRGIEYNDPIFNLYGRILILCNKYYKPFEQ